MILTNDEIDNIHPMDKSFPVWRKNFAREIEAAVVNKIRGYLIYPLIMDDIIFKINEGVNK